MCACVGERASVREYDSAPTAEHGHSSSAFARHRHRLFAGCPPTHAACCDTASNIMIAACYLGERAASPPILLLSVSLPHHCSVPECVCQCVLACVLACMCACLSAYCLYVLASLIHHSPFCCQSHKFSRTKTQFFNLNGSKMTRK